jgi:Xaa-Pro aminopeptidase
MRHAGAIGGAIFDRAMRAAIPGATEGEAVGAGFAFAATVPGCAHWSFLGAGRDASMLHRSPLPPWEASARYQRGDVLHYDCYGFVDGYAYDLARTFVVGEEPTREQERLTDATAAAVAAMGDRLVLRPTFADLHATGLAALRDAGITPVAAFGSTESDSPEAIGPGFGHCIGAGFFPPLVIPQGPDANVVVEPPCGISFEVFATDGHGRFAYHEDNYIVTSDAVHVVSCLPG